MSSYEEITAQVNALSKALYDLPVQKDRSPEQQEEYMRLRKELIDRHYQLIDLNVAALRHSLK